MLSRGTAWLDTGTLNSMHDASTYIKVVEERTGNKIACLEEIAYSLGWINRTQLEVLIKKFGNSSYGFYLKKILSQDKG
jgi:glucose-1-phosphate thymidylyltransferase